MKSRASEFVETRPIDHVFIARWWSIAMCGQVRAQEKGTDLPWVFARLMMLDWDQRFLQLARENSLKIHMYGQFMDDTAK